MMASNREGDKPAERRCEGRGAFQCIMPGKETGSLGRVRDGPTFSPQILLKSRLRLAQIVKQARREAEVARIEPISEPPSEPRDGTGVRIEGLRGAVLISVGKDRQVRHGRVRGGCSVAIMHERWSGATQRG